MDKPKKTTPAAGKKKVIRRLVKNAKTGEIIKTEIVRIDSSGGMTVTSYPAGTPVPTLSSLQTQTKKSSRKLSIEAKAASPVRRPSHDDAVIPTEPAPLPPSSPPRPKVLPKIVKDEPNKAKMDSANVGPSVPANVPGLEDLLRKEEELRKISESGLDGHEKPKPKDGEESLETALISIMKRKRQRDPKARRRGLVASTMPRRASDDELDKALDDAYEDTDYRSISSKKEEHEDEEAERKRRERHRRRKDKKQKERSQVADRDDVEEYQGETGPLDLPEIESYRKRDEETPMDGVESGAPTGEEELSKKMEEASIKQENEEAPLVKQGKEDEESGSDDDKKKKKKKHKHKKKKKTKKQKKRESKSGSERDDGKEDKERRKSKSRSRSRARSLSSVSLSSISSAFSDSFDFAGMNFDPSEEGGFDKALLEYQQVREHVMNTSFVGRGFDPYYRGRGNFRGGFPRGRGFPGPFPGPAWRGPGPMFQFFPMDPNFVPFPGGPMGPDGGKGGDATRGRGVPVNRGPWSGRGLRGRGIPPGFHRNYTEDEQGAAVYVAESSSGSSESGRKKKKKKHRRRSYSSSSYSSSGSSRSRSRSRRRHRRRHRSSSYSSRSSRSYSRSTSRSYRSYSSRSSRSYSKSSYSRSRSHSTNRSKSRSPGKGSPRSWGYGSGDGGRASPSYHAYDADGFKPPVREPRSDDEEVPWWAEFDKTYEVEKKKLEEEKKKLEEEERAMKGEVKAEPQPPSIVSTDEIDVVRCLMTLVDKARSQQEEPLETARECIDDIITRITTAPVQVTQLHEEVEDPFEKVVHDCLDSILDRVCSDDPQTAARLCLKEIIDTVVEQEEEDKANEEATEMEKEITESKQSRLFQCYLKAQKLTEQIKAGRKAKGLPDDKNQNEDDKQKADDDKRRDKRGHRSRHRRRSRSRSRDRGRRRRRRSSSDSRSRSSSRSSDNKVPLVSEESLRQAQALLTMQQQQLQVAGLLGTGMPNLAGLTQAAALAAGITPALLAQTGLKSSDLPSLMGEKPEEKPGVSSAPKTPAKRDKDKSDAMSKKDDLTRKLMQRMREKKQQQEDGDDVSTSFQGRKEKGAEPTADKVFSGGNLLKSRKIAISSTFGKLWSKVEGSPRQDDDNQDGSKLESKGYNKSDIVAAASEVKDQLPNAEKLKAEEHEKKLTAWSDQQARLKEEAKREMREQIERAERAKKDQMKEEILEQERQREIIRIREEVRNQIRKEIQEEIEKQRKTVLEDPAVRDRLLELEALRSQSGLISTEGATPAISSASVQTAASTSAPTMVAGPPMRDQRWYQQQMKNKQDMTKWMESHGYYVAEMDDATMKRMQMTYMQNWTPTQRQGYMQWYWQQKQFPGQSYYPPLHGMLGQRQSQGSSLMGRQQGDFQSRDPVFTRAPSQPQRPEQQRIQPARGMGGTAHQGQRMPYRGGAMPQQQGRSGILPGAQTIPSLMDQPLASSRGFDQPPPQYNETERKAFNYNHDRFQGEQYWMQENQKQQTAQQPPQQQMGQPAPQLLQQQQKPPVPPVQAPNLQQNSEVPSLLNLPPNQIPMTKGAEGTSHADADEQQDFMPPLHQYPPPGLEDEEEEENVVAAQPIPPLGVQQRRQGLDQPPPPGEAMVGMKPPVSGGPEASELAPPGEDVPSTVAGDDSPSKSKKKKKQKKHRKHKKKRYSSSDDDDEKDPEAEKAAILAKLQDLQDVEDGEIASDDGNKAPPQLEEKEVRRKKKNKKEKRKHKRKRNDSSDEEQQPPPQVTQSAPPLPPPPGFFPPLGMQVPQPSFDRNRSNFPEQHHFPPHSTGTGRYEVNPPSMYPPPNPGSLPRMGNHDRRGFLPHPRDHRGSGEPQHMGMRPEQRKPPMGPGGDHNPPPQRKRTPSPLPLVIPTDPHEFEMWQRKMHEKYSDSGPPKKGGVSEAAPSIDQQLVKDIETIRRRQGDRDLHGETNEDVIMMMRMMDDEQRRRRPSPLPHDRPSRDGRKRGHNMMSRGRKRQRRPPMRKNYHDWDKPEDDGLIYTHSGSESSGWGSDGNMDFDRMLAKKRRETEKEKRDGHPPPPHQGWERRDIAQRKDDLFVGGEKPQGIPVIGGGPRPIPTNVSSNRPTPPRHHPEPGPEYLPPDVVKLPSHFPSMGYHQDSRYMEQRGEPRFAPPPIQSGAHPIPRLGAHGAPPIPPMMMNPSIQPRMHHMDYRPRYGM